MDWFPPADRARRLGRNTVNTRVLRRANQKARLSRASTGMNSVCKLSLHRERTSGYLHFCPKPQQSVLAVLLASLKAKPIASCCSDPAWGIAWTVSDTVKPVPPRSIQCRALTGSAIVPRECWPRRPQPAMSFFSRVAQSAGLASRPAEAAAPAPAGSSAAAARPGTPLHLIQYNAETKQFELGQEALAVLRGVNGPVGVVSVCGRARQVRSDHSCC